MVVVAHITSFLSHYKTLNHGYNPLSYMASLEDVKTKQQSQNQATISSICVCVNPQCNITNQR